MLLLLYVVVLNLYVPGGDGVPGLARRRVTLGHAGVAALAFSTGMDVAVEQVVAEDGTVLRHDGSGVPEVEPPRYDGDDAEGIRESLRVHGFATIKHAMLPHEVDEGRRLLWQFLEGDEAPLMTMTRPVGWKQGQPTTWIEGHGDHLIS